MKESLIIYRFKKTDPIKALHWVLVISGILFFITTQSGFCLISTFMGISLMASDNALFVDLEHLRYKRNRIWGNRSIGKWIPIPKGDYLSIFSTTLVCTSHSITYRRIDCKERVVKVNLIHNKNQRLMLFQSYDREEALAVATKISKQLHLRIYDATGRSGFWIDTAEPSKLPPDVPAKSIKNE